MTRSITNRFGIALCAAAFLACQGCDSQKFFETLDVIRALSVLAMEQAVSSEAPGEAHAASDHREHDIPTFTVASLQEVCNVQSKYAAPSSGPDNPRPAEYTAAFAF